MSLTAGGINNPSSTGSSGGGGVVSFTSPNSTLTVAGTTNLTADVNLANANSWTGAQGINLSSAAAFFVGPNGNTNPALRVVTNVASAITGLSITGNASGSGVTLTALGGTNESITLTPKGNGQVLIPDGTVSLPGIAFSSDSTMGMYRPAANVLAFCLAGSNRFAWNAGSLNVLAAGGIGFASGDAGTTTAITRMTQGTGGGFVLTKSLTSTGTPTLFLLTQSADTALTASTESIGVNFDLSASRQFATGALATQREFVIKAPTYTAVGASTITTAATLSITGAPIAGTNVTITNPYALRVEAGTSIFGGSVVLPVGAANSASLGFAGDTNTGLYRFSSSVLGITLGGTAYHLFSANGIQTVAQFVGAASLGSADVGFSRVVAKVWKVSDASTGAGWLQNTAGRGRLGGAVTNATNTMAEITNGTHDLSITLIAGRKYFGRMVLFAQNSTAAEGLKFDFNGGTATMTSIEFGFAGTPIGTTLGVTTSTALATALTVTTATTGDSVYTITFELVCNAGGTFIPEFAENSAHTSGTAQVSNGYMFIEDSPN